MTALKLDTRQTLIAIAGAFNPAIFTPLWIAKNLHKIPDGDTVDVLEMLTEVPGGLAKLSFIEGVALTVSPARLDAIVLSHEASRIDSLEKVISNLVEVLPHTPLHGMGCNLLFVEEDPSDNLLGVFNSPEGIEGEYSVHDRAFSMQLDVDRAVLNFSRAEQNGVVRFSFNYHHAITDPGEYAAAVPGLVQKSVSHASGMLASVYNLTNFETITLMSIEQQEKAGVETDGGAFMEDRYNPNERG